MDLLFALTEIIINVILIMINKREKMKGIDVLEGLFDINLINGYNIGSKLIPIYKGQIMNDKTMTAKAKAESKFKMVGTKLKEDDHTTFEATWKEKGFDNGSRYIKHLIEFDQKSDIQSLDSTLQLKINEIEALKAENERLKAGGDKISILMNQFNEAVKSNKEALEHTKKLTNHILEGESEKGLINAIKSIFKRK